MQKHKKAILYLEDGLFFTGKSLGSLGETSGEVCFNTGMTGYQEIFTDPSYYGQLMVTTNAHIGNYGANLEEVESDSVKIAGLICKNFSYDYSRPNADMSLLEFLDKNNLLAISDVDTRALVSYIRDNGVEQYARDARIAQIYEGANGIQALDLVGRKLPVHMGRYLRRFFHPVQAWINDNTTQPAMHPFVLPLAKAFGRLQIATGQIAQSGLKNPDEAGAASTDYLRLFGLVAFAYLWARMAKIGLDHQTDDEADFYAAKVATAKFFMDKILPQTGALFSSIMAGSGSIMDFPEASF